MVSDAASDNKAVDAQPSSIASLRIAVFRRLLMALVVFNVGHLVQVVASSWLILELTGSPLWVSAMVAAPTLPLLLFSLPAGAAADLFDRRLVLLLSSAILAGASVAMAGLSLVDGLTPGRLVALGLAIGVGVAFFNPAWHAMVPSLVPASLVPGAVSLNSASGGIATAVGPALGGILLFTAGPAACFFLAAFGYLAVLIASATVPPGDLSNEKGTMAVAMAAGIRYLRFSTDYLWLLLLGSLFGFASAALRSMLPSITSERLDGGSALYGLLLGMFGAGAVVGGLSRARASRRLGRRLLPVSIAFFGACGVVVALSGAVALTSVAIAIAGMIWTWILATLNSTFQVLTPDWVRGRAMSAFVLSVFGFLPLGALTAGALGASIGAASSLFVFSIAVMLIGVGSVRMPVPVLEQIRAPVVRDPADVVVPEVAATDDPVMVIATWTVEPGSLDAFLDVLVDLRRVRLRTGAYHWAAYRDTHDPYSISEVFRLPSWEQRVQQMRRLDSDAIEVIRSIDGLGTAEQVVRRVLIEFDVDIEVKARHSLIDPDGRARATRRQQR